MDTLIVFEIVNEMNLILIIFYKVVQLPPLPDCAYMAVWSATKKVIKFFNNPRTKFPIIYRVFQNQLTIRHNFFIKSKKWTEPCGCEPQGCDTRRARCQGYCKSKSKSKSEARIIRWPRSQVLPFESRGYWQSVCQILYDSLSDNGIVGNHYLISHRFKLLYPLLCNQYLGKLSTQIFMSCRCAISVVN